MSLVLRRTALFVAIVLMWALFAAATRAATREIVALPGFAPGTIVVKTAERLLYFSLDGYHALSFPVGVGKAGMQWSGVTRVAVKYVRPAWSPPEIIRSKKPEPARCHSRRFTP